MYLSQYYLPTLKEAPKEASVASHILLLRAGMIRQITSGIYSWLPLGLKVLKKVEAIIRAEMNNTGANEVLLPTIQPVDLWEKSGRFGAEGDLSTEMLVFHDRHKNKLTFAPTAEEVITTVAASGIKSYRDLPKNLYQISWKFRDEIRPRFGLMRCREFLMKDAYSFDIDEKSALLAYEKMFIAYLKAFKRMGLKAIPVKADTGSMGGDYSHEFHILANTGESTIYYEDGLEEFLASSDVLMEDFSKYYANEKEKHDPEHCPISEDKLLTKKGIEVGHIFYLGDKYTKAMDMQIQDQTGQLIYPKMGCYGIGVSRLVAAIIEANHDDKGIVWPASISPFEAIILSLKPEDETCASTVSDLYDALCALGKEVLVDDTSDSIGVKFNRAELIGTPWIIAIGPKSLATGVAEVKQRATGEKHELSIEAIKVMFTKS